MYSLIEADIGDLNTTHREAMARVGEAVRQTQAAQADHRRALDELTKAEALARFDAMSAHAAELDRRLCETVAELAALARQAGKPANGLSTAFRPSNSLSSMIRLGNIPPRSAA